MGGEPSGVQGPCLPGGASGWAQVGQGSLLPCSWQSSPHGSPLAAF